MLPSPVCASQVGRAFAVRMVSFTRLHPSITIQVHKTVVIFSSSGFFANLDADSRFTDIDECFDPDYPAGCDQKCHNIPGSFQCRCEAGYFTTNKINCVGEAWFFSSLFSVVRETLSQQWRRPAVTVAVESALVEQESSWANTEVFQSCIVLFKSSLLYLFLMDVGTLHASQEKLCCPSWRPRGLNVCCFSELTQGDLLWMWSDFKFEKMTIEIPLAVNLMSRCQ